MAFYVARRLAWTLVVVLAVLALTYAVFVLLPAGDVATRFAGKSPSPEALQQIRHRLGLDHPFWYQYGKFVATFFSGDTYGWPGLGYSYSGGYSVLSQITKSAPPTLCLIAGASVIWLVTGVSIGVVSAAKRRTIVDRLAMAFALLGISTPVFWLGLMALWIFWVKLGLPFDSGYAPISDGLWNWMRHLILPWCVLAMLYAAFYARVTRNTLLETLGEDYIRTARAKGLSERQVLLRHGLRASLTPVVTMFGLDIALLVGGAIITESVFNIHGLGYLAVSSALGQDLPVVLGVTMLTATAVAVMNLLVDIVYAYLDPRVRLG